jgi:DNA polymerase III delta prime subunit
MSTNDIFAKRLQEYIEAWFDYHPEPENLELFEFPETITGKETTINVFAADQILDNYMIKICFPTTNKRVQAQNYLLELAKIMSIEMVGLSRNLFLFTDRRF